MAMSRYGKTLTISMTQEQSARLEDIASSAGFVWGRYGNISALLRAVADGDYLILPAPVFSDDAPLDEGIRWRSNPTQYGERR